MTEVRRRPVEPPPTPWSMPPIDDDAGDLIATGADLLPGTLLAAYRSGLFPMPVRHLGRQRLAWWSPEPRAVLPLDGLVVSKSLRRSLRRYTTTVDTAFEAVIDACADPGREGRWITKDVRAAYVELHRLGWAHSVEVWDVADGTLAGGLYGVAIGGLFAGESMFHHRTDASKVALHALVEVLRDDPGHGAGRLLDVQWRTDHLATLGVVEIPRREYLRLLGLALEMPPPHAFAAED